MESLIGDFPSISGAKAKRKKWMEIPSHRNLAILTPSKQGFFQGFGGWRGEKTPFLLVTLLRCDLTLIKIWNVY